MIEKIRTIKNPLTIFAIFAAIAEFSSTVVLPFLEHDLQKVFIWFVMLFPVSLLALFFITLNWNHKVLYAPSDFKNEENFFRNFEKSSVEEQKNKLDIDVKQEFEDEPTINNSKKKEKHEKLIVQDATHIHKTNNIEIFKSHYIVAENLVLRELEQEFHCPITREVSFGEKNNRVYFDGIAVTNGQVIVIEVKLLRRKNFNIAPFVFLGDACKKAQLQAKKDNIDFMLYVAIVTILSEQENLQIKERLENLFRDKNFHFEIRFFNFDLLKKKYGIGE